MGQLTTFLIVALLLFVSAIYSGLNIAFMSLSVNELRRASKIGNQKAAKLLPLRRRGHLVLSAVLIINIATISANSLLLNRYLASWLAGATATLLTVILAEIIPQSIFIRSPLKYSFRFRAFLIGGTILTYPLSKPMEMLLNRLLPAGQARLYSRRELGVIIAEQYDNKASELDEDEIDIMRGALSLSEKRTKDIMVPLDQVFYLFSDTLIDQALVARARRQSYSRIPVLSHDLKSCLGIVMLRDLIDKHEQDSIVANLTMHPTKLLGYNTALDTLFKKFISNKSHMIAVEKDDRVIGVVTIEDLLEEIINHEIEDEKDRLKRQQPDLEINN